MVTRSEIGQSLNLSNMIIDPGRKNRPGTKMRPSSLTIHNTDNTNPGADAEAHGRFVTKTGYYMYNGKKRWVSWHYTVDEDSVAKHLPINEVGYHAGRNANLSSIAIEICMNGGADQAATDDRAATLIAILMYDLGFGKDDIRTHKFWTNKHCPSRLLEQATGFGWNDLLDRAIAIKDTIEPDPQKSDDNLAEELSDLPEPGEVKSFQFDENQEELLSGEVDHEQLRRHLFTANGT